MDNTYQSPVVLSLCPGLRGLERGIERAIQKPVRVAVYVEIEAVIIENLLAGMEAGILDATPIWSNLKTFPYREFHNKIHGIIGGYPCQPFSVAGNRKGKNDPRHLWPYIYRIVQSTKPIFCFFENVAGHLNLGFEEVSRDLRKVGYRVEAGIFSAQEVGAPHRRERLFILAVLANSDRNGWPSYGSVSTSGKDDTQRWEECFEKLRPMRTGGKTRRLSKNKTRNNELANTSGFDRRLPKSIKWRKSLKASRSCEIISNPNKSRLWRKYQRRFQSKIIRGSKKLSYSSKQYVQRSFRKIKNKEKWEKQRKRQIRLQSFNGFPASPGGGQYEWEHPRTVKSGMGCTINGYNFREDLLRALGNSVVEQTAELAWNVLWEKQMKLK